MKTIKNKNKMKKLINIPIIILFLYIQQIQLSYSVLVSIKNNLRMAPQYVLLNMIIVAVPFCVLLIVFRKIRKTLIINVCIITILSLLNYHVLLFHGSPFFAWDIPSIPTAIDVATEYSFIFDGIVLRIILFLCIEVVFWIAYCLFCKKNLIDEIINDKWMISFPVLNICLVIILFFSPFAIFSEGIITWSWEPSVQQYGYGVCLLNSAQVSITPYKIPTGYSADVIICDNSDNANNVKIEELPDIILILNETFSDLNVYTNIGESKRIFEKLNNINGIIKGYSFSPLVGGGTNNSEYELLTSNSMWGLNISAPFQYLNLKGSNSVVSYMNTLGYTTVGMHCGTDTNYNRHNAYPSIGFDEVRLGWKDFKYLDKNGNRYWLDSENYKDMIEVYKSCDDLPRFMYILTYQNHGGYERNDSSMDTVSITENFGEYTDDINEYLTSIEKSIDAFIELTEYYKNSERDVVIRMLGDHMPSFITYLSTNRDFTSRQQEMAKRTVPYYVWSNAEINESVFTEYVSMVDLVPLLLKSMDMPLTGYYKEIIKLNEVVPVRTNIGLCINSDGTIDEITDEHDYYDEIQNYYYLEYNNLIHSDNYNVSWFELRN